MPVTLNLNVKLALDGAALAGALAPILDQFKDQIVSALSDKVDALKADADATAARVTGHVADLKQQLADLRKQLADGAPPEVLATLDAVDTTIKGLDPADPTVLPPTP